MFAVACRRFCVRGGGGAGTAVEYKRGVLGVREEDKQLFLWPAGTQPSGFGCNI